MSANVESFCRRGDINFCDNRQVLGVSCDDYRCHGAFAEYVAIPQRILYKLPEKLSFEEAAMVEPLSIAVHAVERTRISLNDTAVVVGTGMVGLLVVQALRARGCGQIIAVDNLGFSSLDHAYCQAHVSRRDRLVTCHHDHFYSRLPT